MPPKKNLGERKKAGVCLPNHEVTWQHETDF